MQMHSASVPGSRIFLIVSATGFGCPGYARVSYCVDYDMIKRSFLAFEKLYQSYR